MAMIEQRGDTWRVRIRRAGQSRSATFRSQEAAENWAQAEEAAIRYQTMLRETGPTADSIKTPSDAAKYSSRYVSGPGVYILFYGYRVAYVGQSKNVMNRLQQHAKNGRAFDRYVVIPCDPADLDATEREFIRRLSPPGNQQMRHQCGNSSETRMNA